MTTRPKPNVAGSLTTPGVGPTAPRVVVLLLVSMIGGCYTTDAARKQAGVVAADLDQYRREQSDRLDQINRQYRFDYAHLIADVTALREAQLRQFFELDSMAAADAVLTDWEIQTLPRAIRDRFSQSLERRRQRLLETDAAIDAARAAYADAYREVQLNLAQLKSAQASAEALAVKEDQRQATSDFIQTVARIYGKLEDENKSGSQSTNK